MKKKKHQVIPHFLVKVLRQKYLECKCSRERTHWHIIWLFADTTHPRTPRELAEIVGCTPDWVRKLLKRYNIEGEAAMQDKRENNKGQRFLDETQQAALETALSVPADGGLWTGPKVAAWISDTLQRPVGDVSGWKYLRRLGWTLQTPRPQHQAAATPDEQ
ncbi:MAG: winged helix-turn-helix domain-containing protein [Candidatus Poribacteria bacterium]|nr:winged helix-turn-helix domain-containing protein [Candidatus Poribacteria bacterium]